MAVKVRKLQSLFAPRFLAFCITYNMYISGPSLLIESTDSMIHGPYYKSNVHTVYTVFILADGLGVLLRYHRKWS